MSFVGDLRISGSQYENSAYPPCIMNILSLKECGEGANRALGFIAAFLGQINTPIDEAREGVYKFRRKVGSKS